MDEIARSYDELAEHAETDLTKSDVNAGTLLASGPGCHGYDRAGRYNHHDAQRPQTVDCMDGTTRACHAELRMQTTPFVDFPM
jgi:hypothetical protein